MTRRVKVAWGSGDLFLVQLSDGSFAVGQVLSSEPDALASALCVFSSCKVHAPHDAGVTAIKEDEVVSALFVPREPLDFGIWRVVSKSAPLDGERFVPLNALRSNGFVGAKVIGWKSVIEFLNAYHGLRNWDDYWHTPDYFDMLLISGDKKPINVRLSASRNA